MPCQIDQSGRCEDTNKPTAMSLANQQVRCIQIKAIEKQKLLRALKNLGYSKKKFAWRLFAVLIFLLLKSQKKGQKINFLIIDHEYPGHEADIINSLTQLLRKTAMEIPEISFASIGKKSSAHLAAIEVFRGKRKADAIVKAEDLLPFFYPKKRKPRL